MARKGCGSFERIMASLNKEISEITDGELFGIFIHILQCKLCSDKIRAFYDKQDRLGKLLFKSQYSCFKRRMKELTRCKIKRQLLDDFGGALDSFFSNLDPQQEKLVGEKNDLLLENVNNCELCGVEKTWINLLDFDQRVNPLDDAKGRVASFFKALFSFLTKSK